MRAISTPTSASDRAVLPGPAPPSAPVSPADLQRRRSFGSLGRKCSQDSSSVLMMKSESLRIFTARESMIRFRSSSKSGMDWTWRRRRKKKLGDVAADDGFFELFLHAGGSLNFFHAQQPFRR